MKKTVSVLLALALGLCIGAGALAEPIKLGGIAPLTGPVSSYGILVREGADLYIEELNAAGGLMGETVEIVWMDDTHDAVEATNAYNQLVSDGVVALVGPVTTTPTLAAAARAAQDNMPLISPSATAYDVTSAGPNVFRTCFLDPFQAELLALMAFETLEAEKVAVLFDNTNDYSIGLSESFKAKSEELGMEVVAVEAAVEGDADYTPQLIKIADAEPDAVIVCYYYETGALVLRQAVDVGLDAYMLGADGWAGIEKQLVDAPELLDKAFYCDQFSAADESPVVQDFVASFSEKYGKTPTMFNALGYDTAKVLLTAIGNAGTTEDRAAIVAAIKATDLDCTTGHITFDDHNDPIKSAFMMGFVDGEPTLKVRIDPK